MSLLLDFEVEDPKKKKTEKKEKVETPALPKRSISELIAEAEKKKFGSETFEVAIHTSNFWYVEGEIYRVRKNGLGELRTENFIFPGAYGNISPKDCEKIP